MDANFWLLEEGECRKVCRLPSLYCLTRLIVDGKGEKFPLETIAPSPTTKGIVCFYGILISVYCANGEFVVLLPFIFAFWNIVEISILLLSNYLALELLVIFSKSKTCDVAF